MKYTGSRRIDSASYEEIYVKTLHFLRSNPEFSGMARGEAFSEITDFGFELTDPRNRMVWSKARSTNYEFAMKMFLWILSGGSDPTSLLGVNPNAKNYVDVKSDGTAAPLNTAYGPRIVSQYKGVLRELLRDPESRRATICILDSGDEEVRDDEETKTEYPCTETITFLIRDGKLHCYVNMRSNNMVTTVVYDVFVFTMLQEWILRLYNGSVKDQILLGSYYHHCTSAHYFASQKPLLEKILGELPNSVIGGENA